MKILLVNYRYFVSGGPEKYMFNIKEVLENNGHEVIPFSVRSNRNFESEYTNYFVEPIGDRNTVYYEEVKKTPKTIIQLLSRSTYSLEVRKAIRRIIKDTNPDLVYILHFINKLSPSVIDGAKKEGIPVVVRLSDYFLLCPRFDFLYKKKICEECLIKGLRLCIKRKCVKNSLFASIVRVISMKLHDIMKIYEKVDVFITPSNFLRNKLLENGFRDSQIKYVPTFTQINNWDGDFVNGNYGLYFGRITVEKGIENIVKAYEKLPNHRVKIMGDDTTEEAMRLKKYIGENKIENIEFVGFKSGKELNDIIKYAKFVIIPSIWYDNLPNTALEAFKYCKPVIASNIGSLPELVEDGINGFLFEPNDIKSLIDLIKKMDDEKLVRDMGKHSLNILQNKFSEKAHYRSLIQIFNKLLK